MTPPRASVIVVSRDRPDALLLCLLSLAQQDHPAFEIVVVADAAGLLAVDRAGLSRQVRTARCDEPNISQARNIGLAQAAGDVVAFIDDDAVAEPTWLSALTAPLGDTRVAAAGGFVRGRNGISFQARAARVDASGAETPIALPGTAPVVLESRPGDAIKTEGTNCAFRRSLLLEMGGFDPAFRYFMDETDVNLRLAAQGAPTAVVPLAEVHHATAPSARRAASRVPRSLFDIAASTAVFLRKHAQNIDMGAALTLLQQAQRRRLLHHMVAGRCEPRDVPRLLGTLSAGWDDGLVRRIAPLPPIPDAPPAFLPFSGDPGFAEMTVLAGRSWNAWTFQRKARARIAQGRRVSLFLFSPTTLHHHVRFTRDGIWEQRGGLFGRSDRDQPMFQVMGFAQRLARETARIAPQRGI